MWRKPLQIHPNSRNEPTTANTDENRFELTEICLSEQLHPNRPLASNHVRVVERRYIRQTMLLLQAGGVGLRGVEVGSMQDHRAAEARDVLVLDFGSA